MRKTGSVLLASVALFVLLPFLATDAKAQIAQGWDFSVSAFGGAAIPYSPNVEVHNLPLTLLPSGATGTGDGTLKDVNLQTSVSFGGKITAWSTAFRPATGMDFGAEIDVTNYRPDMESQTVTGQGTFTSAATGTLTGSIPIIMPNTIDVNSTIVAGNLLARVPIYRSDEFPNGRLQWYLGAGLGAEISNLKLAGSDSDSDTALAIQALAGGKVFLNKIFALFVEYKFTHSEHSWDLAGTKIQGDFNVNHVVGGLAVHF